MVIPSPEIQGGHATRLSLKGEAHAAGLGCCRGKLLGVVDLGDTLTMYYFVLAVFLIVFAVILRTVHSPFGQVIKAIRENEPRTVSIR
jgi:ABC-type branched-subunit amino acid transport system permease subunit